MKDMLKFVVMSDLHLVPEGGHSKGLDTVARFRQAVASLNANHGDAAFCVLAGDLADRGEPAAYAALRAVAADIAMPVHFMLGNHDDRPTFLAEVPEAVTDAHGFVQSGIDAGGHRVLLLDSSEPGVVGGVLCARRLDWLAAELDAALDRPVIVLLHHHVNPLMMPVDRIRLAEPERLVMVLHRHDDIRMVLAGHVHRTTAATWHGLPFATLSGNHYPVSAHLPGMPGQQQSFEGPAQYAVVLADADGCLVHFHNYIDRHAELARGLFARPAEAAVKKASIA